MVWPVFGFCSRFIDFLLSTFWIESNNNQISKDQFREIIQDAEEKCRYTDIDQIYNDQWCANDWAGITCWPRTRRNETARVNCPNYIQDFDSSKELERMCNANGSWTTIPLADILSECIVENSGKSQTELPKNIYK